MPPTPRHQEELYLLYIRFVTVNNETQLNVINIYFLTGLNFLFKYNIIALKIIL